MSAQRFQGALKFSTAFIISLALGTGCTGRGIGGGRFVTEPDAATPPATVALNPVVPAPRICFENFDIPTRLHALTSQEMQTLRSDSSSLPYQVSPASTEAATPLEMSNRPVLYTLDSGPQISRAQVVFRVSMVLPARSTIQAESFNPTIRLNVQKHDADSAELAEAMCHIESRTCSGAAFLNDDWTSARNASFFNGRQDRANNFFQDQMTGLVRGGNTQNVDGTVVLPLRQLLANGSTALTGTELVELIYGNASPTEPVRRTWTFAILDNVNVLSSGSSATASLQVDACAPDAADYRERIQAIVENRPVVRTSTSVSSTPVVTTLNQ